MDELKEIKSDIKDLDNRVTDVEKDMAVMREHNNHRDELIAENIKVLGKLDETLQENKIVMTTLTDKVSNQSDKIDNLENKINSVQNSQSNQINNLENKINAVQEERNINIVKWLRDNWYTIILGGGFLYEVIKDLV